MNPQPRAGHDDEEPTYARDTVLAAVNAGADLIHTELGLGERDDDLTNLVVNAAMTCLDHPDATFEQVVHENYDHPPEEVRQWWTTWT